MIKKGNTALFEKTAKALRELQKNLPKLSAGEKATLELMLDKEALQGLKESAEDIKHGRIISFEDFKKDL